MSESAQQYIARITGFVGDHDPWVLLAEAPGRLRSFVERASPATLAWKPTPQVWSITEIAAHLADAEIVGAWRIRAVLAEDNVALQPYDQNAWATAFRYAETPAADSVATLCGAAAGDAPAASQRRSRAPPACGTACRAGPGEHPAPDADVRRTRPEPPRADRASAGRGAGSNRPLIRWKPAHAAGNLADGVVN